MKAIKVIKIIILIFVILFPSCHDDCEPNHSNLGMKLYGNHKLDKINLSLNDTNTVRYYIYDNDTMYFKWQTNSGEYILSKINREKVRVRIIEKDIKPYVKFAWLPYHEPNIEKAFNSYIVYMVIVCNEKDKPLDYIKVNNNG